MKKAFIIGANKNSLEYAEQDAEKMKKALSSEFDVYRFDTNSTESKDFPDNIRTFFQDLSDNDVALFYFAGHSFLGANNRLYLAVQTSDISVQDSCLCMNDVISVIDQCPAKNKMIILDSCKSGVILDSIDFSLKKTNYAVLCATESWMEITEEKGNSVGFKGGLLTHLLDQAFREKQIFDDESLTTALLIDWIKREEERYINEFKLKSNIRVNVGNPFELFNLFSHLPNNIIDDKFVARNIPEVCFDYLKIVEKMDDEFPLNLIGSENELWIPFLNFIQALSIPSMQSKKFLDDIKGVFNNLQYPRRSDLIIFFRKYVEIEILLKIYISLRAEFGVELPTDPSFYKRLKNVDQFSYSQEFMRFFTSHWLKLSDRHKEKQVYLDLALSKIIHLDEIEDKSQKVLDSLGESIRVVIDSIDVEDKSFRANDEIAAIAKLTHSSKNIDDFLSVFGKIKNQVKVVHHEFILKFEKEMNSLPVPKTLKHQVKL